MNGDDEALAIVRSWDWGRWDCDFCEVVTVQRSISDCVNELASNGYRRALDLVLSLLARGELSASGRYKWLGFLGEHNQSEGHGVIPSRRWQGLQAGLAAPRDRDGRPPNVNLELISAVHKGSCELPVADWDWRNSRFSTATATGLVFKDDYFEEWFSAWDICILPPTRSTDALEEQQPDTVSVGNKGGRPPTYAWEKAVAALVFKWADNGSWQPASQAGVQKELKEWFKAQGETPSDSLLKKHAQWLFKEFDRRKLDGQ